VLPNRNEIAVGQSPNPQVLPLQWEHHLHWRFEIRMNGKEAPKAKSHSHTHICWPV